MEYMVNDDTGLNPPLWWQSITWENYPTPLEMNITFSFNKSYQLEGKVVISARYLRPKRMVLYKSADYGVTWEPLQYFYHDCGQLPTQLNKSHPEVPICTVDDSKMLPYMDGDITFAVEDRQALFLESSLTNYDKLYEAYSNTQLDEFLQFTDLRIGLLEPGTDGNENIQSWKNLIQYFYTIANVEVSAR